VQSFACGRIEAPDSDDVKTAWTNKRLQRLFRKYNRLYWCSDLPEYSVFITKEFNGARCEKARHIISINADIHDNDKELKADLLHEMAHAATNIGHGKLWKAEMDRIRNLGAPVSAFDFQPTIGRKEILKDFLDAAEQGLTWPDALSRIGWEYGLVKSDGQAVDKNVAAMLRIARRFFRD
jgi:hypothetical protein